MTERSYTPKVQAEARRRGVNLASVQGTGPGGRVSMDDVRAAAPNASPQAAAPTAPAGRTWPTRSTFNATLVVQLDPYGRNPLVDDLRQSVPAAYALAMREGPPPTLFASGDLPPFCASGIDPQMLAKVPWFLRHEAAAGTNPGTVLAMIEDTATDPDGHLFESRTAGATEYVARMHAWASGHQ